MGRRSARDLKTKDLTRRDAGDCASWIVVKPSLLHKHGTQLYSVADDDDC